MRWMVKTPDKVADAIVAAAGRQARGDRAEVPLPRLHLAARGRARAGARDGRQGPPLARRYGRRARGRTRRRRPAGARGSRSARRTAPSRASASRSRRTGGSTRVADRVALGADQRGVALRRVGDRGQRRRRGSLVRLRRPVADRVERALGALALVGVVERLAAHGQHELGIARGAVVVDAELARRHALRGAASRPRRSRTRRPRRPCPAASDLTAAKPIVTFLTRS